jgi:protein-S-isoprenylcysteine O-methyltransferase Ste14
MQRSAAGLGTAVFFVIGPGVVAGLVPWLISGWQVRGPITPLVILRMVLGSVLLVAAVVVLVRAFTRFVTEGSGTPAPVAPPERLVVGGEYRFVRNPMYLALITAVLGQAMIFGSLALLLYAIGLWAITAAFVRFYEEPTLSRRYGDEYERYRQAVRAWLPRLHPWRPDLDHSSQSS